MCLQQTYISIREHCVAIRRPVDRSLLYALLPRNHLSCRLLVSHCLARCRVVDLLSRCGERIGIRYGCLRRHASLSRFHFGQVQEEALDVMDVPAHTGTQGQDQGLLGSSCVESLVGTSATAENQVSTVRCLEPELVAKVAESASRSGEVLIGLQSDAVAAHSSMRMCTIVALVRLIASMVVELVAIDQFSVVKHLDILDVWHSLEVRFESFYVLVLFLRVPMRLSVGTCTLDVFCPVSFRHMSQILLTIFCLQIIRMN